MFAITRRALRDERGVGVVAALLIIMILALLGTVMVATTVREMDAGRLHAQGEQALAVACAGMEFAQTKYAADPTWTGVPAPGRPVGDGSFIVTIATVDAEGNPLPLGTKALRVTGTVRGGRRILSRLVYNSGSMTTPTATANGNAVNVPSGKVMANAANLLDAQAPNGTFAIGDWAGPDMGTWSTFLAPVMPSGTITKVEVLLYGYLSQSLTDDYGSIRIYFNNARQKAAKSLSFSVLNTHVGAANAGYWVLDVTSSRAWTVADFTGDLEINYRNLRKKTNDGVLIYLDCASFRVTTTGGGVITLGLFQEVVT